jgi:hypothetical protein
MFMSSRLADVQNASRLYISRMKTERKIELLDIAIT